MYKEKIKKLWNAIILLYSYNWLQLNLALSFFLSVNEKKGYVYLSLMVNLVLLPLMLWLFQFIVIIITYDLTDIRYIMDHTIALYFYKKTYIYYDQSRSNNIFGQIEIKIVYTELVYFINT
jgi:hypothetical protein